MKKILALFIAFSMLLAFCACESGTPSQNGDDTPKSDDQAYSEAEIKRYSKAVKALENYLSGGDLKISTEVPNTVLYYNDAMAYIYETFSLMKDYGDSAEYLSHFDTINDVCVGESWTITGNPKKLGYENVSHEYYLNYEYTSMGQLLYYHDHQHTSEYRHLLSEWMDEYVYEYDDSGRLRRVGVVDGEYLEGIYTLSYDENGRLISELFENQRVESYVSRVDYIYNDLGQLVRRTFKGVEYSGEDYSQTVYEYDANGLLIKEIHGPNGDMSWMANRTTTTYSYDSDGHLTQKTVLAEREYLWGYFNYTYTDIYDYTCDSSGRILKEKLTYGKRVYQDGREEEPSDSYREITYLYDNYYLYFE